MLKKVLVILDGPPLAELPLCHVAQLVRPAGTEEVVLLSIVEAGGEREVQTAAGYMRDRAEHLRKMWDETAFVAPTVRVEAFRAPWGQAANHIISYAENNGLDMIVMSTHGRSGIGRWLVGSVAERVIRGAYIPVLLVRAADEGTPPPSPITRILVPVDGSEIAEQALTYAEHLATEVPGCVVLLYVEQTPVSVSCVANGTPWARASKLQ